MNCSKLTAQSSQLSAALIALCVSVSAQSPKTVADGVYTDAQATRGAAAYATSCGGCHRPDLTGADGPALRDERFKKTFAGKDLEAFYTKIATTMPRGNPASLADDVYLDIVAHLLRENGFPAGASELTHESMNGVAMLPTQPKPLSPVGDFSYVEVVGCVSRDERGGWRLTHAGEPAAVRAEAPVDPSHLESLPLGDRTLALLDAIAYAPDSRVGKKVYVRGLLVRTAGDPRITISSIENVAAGCR